MKIIKIVIKNLPFIICMLTVLACSHKPRQFKSISILADIKYDPWGEEPFISKEWLKKEVSYEEMEKNFRNDISWKRLRPLLLKGDEIWFYNSPPEYWQRLLGERGYAIVREGKPIGGFLTALN